VRFAFRQAVAVPPGRAAAAYGSPAFYEDRPARDDIEVVEVVRHEPSGSWVLIEVRYAFKGSLSPAVRRVVHQDKMSWITRTEVLATEARTRWVVLPDHYPDRLTASGEFRFEPGPDGPDTTVIAVDGELKVHVPVVGRSVERVIVSGLQSYLEDEAATIPDWVSQSD
jgi:hypothetical protein